MYTLFISTTYSTGTEEKKLPLLIVIIELIFTIYI